MISFNGHSGCSIIMLSDDIVRKTSSTIEYNDRLNSQMKKQKQFKHSVIKTSEIVDCGYTVDGLFYFDMKYIRGINLSVYFQQNTLDSCVKIIDLFSTFNTGIRLLLYSRESIYFFLFNIIKHFAPKHYFYRG